MQQADPFLVFSVPAFYHFTDIRHVPLIRKHGGLFSMAELRKRHIEVPYPGGNEWSQDADKTSGMDEYVHLCFRPNHPMEYMAREEGRIDRSIFLEIDPQILTIGGIMFSPGVSNKSGMTIHSLEKARELIDFEVLYTRTDWHDSEIQLRLRAAEKAELLVPHHVPLEYIRNLPNG
ncbi:MAG: DarT ssDNA thymidine ADP-ribosyltransferase family protein [Fimbriimonas sp.]